MWRRTSTSLCASHGAKRWTERRKPMEKIINVPIDEDTKAALEQQADEDGRATARQAARYVKEEVLRRAKKK